MLVITLLPWGAYHGAGRGPLLMASETAAAMSEASDSLRAAAPPGKAATLASQPRRCKTGVLIGTTCTPDALMDKATPLAPPKGSGLGLNAQTRGLATALPDSPPRRPPRAA